MAVIVGENWSRVPAELEERPMPPSRERNYPPQHTTGDDGGRLPDPLGHWDEVRVES